MTKIDLIVALENLEDGKHIWAICPFSGDPFAFELNIRGDEVLIEQDEEALEVPVIKYDCDEDVWSIEVMKKEDAPVEEEF
jgi:hypothetical protein